jgi:hypothetical protein
MAMNGVIVYFPWGSGGNFVRNIATINLDFDFLDTFEYKQDFNTVDDRYNFLVDYYNTDFEEWVLREFNLRRTLYPRYYENNLIAYYNPGYRMIYDYHGHSYEIAHVLKNGKLKHWDRIGITENRVIDSTSDWTLVDCAHICLIPRNVQLITQIYCSKNPSLNQFQQFVGDRTKEEYTLNTNIGLTNNISYLAQNLKNLGANVNVFDADDLFKEDGYDLMMNILNTISAPVNIKYVKSLHEIWLNDTKKAYYNYFKEDLTL